MQVLIYINVISFSTFCIGLGKPSPSNSRAPIQGGPYAPPPGPPPQWNGQWETALPQVHSYSRQNTVPSRRGQSSNTVKIASREEEFRRLFKACEAGKGNARLLREAIVYAKPQDLKNNALIEVRPPLPAVDPC